MANIFRLIKILSALIVSSLFLTACTTDTTTLNQQKLNNRAETGAVRVHLNDMLQKMDAKKNPGNHINDIRSYALNNFTSLSKTELNLIQSSNPKIYHDSNTMEYCYVWFLPDKGGCLEVVATPPPMCTPVAVFRRDRVYYP